MRTKSRYREFKDGGRVDLPGQDELPIEPPIEQPTEAISAPPEAPVVDNQPQQPEQPSNDAALALQRQIDELKKSEALQRQRAAQAAMPQDPVTREQKLALWQQTGMSEGEAHFLAEHPEMIDHSEITGFAVHQANQAGHQRGSPEHFHAVKTIFDEQFNQGQAGSPVMQPTPKFFQPPPLPAAPKPANFVSAPVSREVPTGSGRPRGGQVKLTPSEVEAAKISGISLEEYEREKLKYESMKADGSYRDARETQR